MKIAVVTDDQHTISRHFGHAENYIVISAEQGRIVDQKMLSKPAHRQFDEEQNCRHRGRAERQGKGFGHHANFRYEQMFENIKDCDVLLTRGMGRGAYLDLQKLGITPIVTSIEDVETAIQAVLDDSITNHTEELH